MSILLRLFVFGVGVAGACRCVQEAAGAARRLARVLPYSAGAIAHKALWQLAACSLQVQAARRKCFTLSMFHRSTFHALTFSWSTFHPLKVAG